MAPTCSSTGETLSAEEDGLPCVIPACNDLDPDQHGTAGGIDFRGSKPTPGYLSQALSFSGCWTGTMNPNDCTPRSYGSHKGGNAVHNTCAESISGNNFANSDSVVKHICFDHSKTDGMGQVTLTEVKTAAFTTGRLNNKLVCSWTRRKILANVMATVLKEAKPAMDCGHTYELVCSDKLLCDAFVGLLQGPDQNPARVDIGNSKLKPVLVTRGDILSDLSLNLTDMDWTSRSMYLQIMRVTIRQYCGR